MKLLTKWVCIALAVLFSLPSFAALVFADWYDEVSGGSYAPIVGEPYVAETFCGVESRYSLTTEEYQCNELIMRFYREAYGLRILAYMNIGLIMATDGYEFVTPSVPKKGDIIYSPAQFRQYKSDHWAIVKDYSNGKITLFEQNVKWNGKAGTGRQLKFPSEYYYLYTPVAKAGFPAPVLKGVSAEQTTSTTAASTTETTTAVTTVSETTAEESFEAGEVTTAAKSTTLPGRQKTASKQTEAVTEAPEVQSGDAASETLTASSSAAIITQTVSMSPLTAASDDEPALPDPLAYETVPVEETDIMFADYEDGAFATATDTELLPETEEETVIQPESVTKAAERKRRKKMYKFIAVGMALFTLIAAAGVTFAAIGKRR